MKKFLGLLLMLGFHFNACYALQIAPPVSIIPSILSTYLRSDSKTEVTYTVTNNMPINLNTINILNLGSTGNGKVQIVNNLCDNTTLNVGQSCTFSVLIYGADQPVNFSLRPIICSNQNQYCTQALPQYALNINTINITHPLRAYVGVKTSKQNDDNFKDYDIVPIELNTNKFDTPITGFSTSNLDDISLSPDGSLLYVGNRGDNSLKVINLQNDQMIASVDLGAIPVAIAASKDGSRIYVATPLTGIKVINATNYEIIATIPCQQLSGAIAISPDDKWIYAASDEEVLIINAINNTVATAVAVDGLATGIVVTPDGNSLYVTNQNRNNVSVINLKTDKAIAVIPADLRPMAIAISPDGSRVYVANQTLNIVSVIDTADNKRIYTIMTSVASPAGISISPDGSLLYIDDYQDNFVTIVDTSTNKVLNILDMGNPCTTTGNFVG
jgi:YVTN family beta-propeller protein